jgi:hypothetical protein
MHDARMHHALALRDELYARHSGYMNNMSSDGLPHAPSQKWRGAGTHRRTPIITVTDRDGVPGRKRVQWTYSILEAVLALLLSTVIIT